MRMDNLFADRYHVIYPDFKAYGWMTGWQIFEKRSTPKVDLEPEIVNVIEQPNHARRMELEELWPDTKEYDQNSPGIIERANDIDKRCFQSDADKSFWLNVLRVPICASYLAACAKVMPHRILELGTGGDSAHSTGMFTYWLSNISNDGILISTDRHPLSHAWLRYRHYDFWHFIQGDSLTVMKALQKDEIRGLPNSFDLIFIDSSHTYPHTLKELEQASGMTNAILMDDSTVPEVQQSLYEFLITNTEWLKVDLAHGVTLLERHDYIR